MKSRVSALAVAAILILPSAARSQEAAVSSDDIRKVAPALDAYRQVRLFDDLWKRPDLSPRDRGLVTVAALIARNQAIELPFYVERALDSGVKPAELSEVIVHLNFYAGSAGAMTAVAATKEAFSRRGVTAAQLPAVTPAKLPLDEKSEADRAQRVGQQFGAVSRGLVHYTTDILFRDLWLRPDLAARDRSLVTVSALVANGQVGQIPFHLGRAMDNGLTQAEAGEVLTQLAFYAGWPAAFSAVSVFKDVFEKRPK